MPETPTITEPPILTEDELEAHFIVLEEILVSTNALATKFVAELPGPSPETKLQKAERYLDRLGTYIETVLDEHPGANAEAGKDFTAYQIGRLHQAAKTNWPEKA
ncbi:hypothetical protein [Microvirga lotononidis]|uniref:Uncharacterized protein n=1 Tax=Microvirga lotononidis TaxID=864069 RepID=I4YRP3_9HYPH|nr:hypothetical protein [Microvirga lotononidis]EIM26635.1 hypothetical protein MicloDRAFT_00031840 [Microvirga lotononidis]WQO32080.1 hypothetical protein U0023_35355 [Microvirga lotononidis]